MSGASAMTVRIEVARKDFGDRPILRDVAFEIAPGEVVALLGPSGVGKSTLLRILAGLDSNYEGAVTGAPRLAMVFQEPTLLPWRSARDNIRLAAEVSAPVAEAALAEVGLAGRGDAYPRALSLGQQRRVSLARAFAVRPALLLLDEAFASLDEAAAAQARALTLSLLEAHGAAALMVTHDVREAAQMADRVIRLAGAPAGVVSEVRLEKPRLDRDADWIDAAARRV